MYLCVCVCIEREKGGGTYADEGEDHVEGVEHGRQRHGERRHQLPQRPDLAPRRGPRRGMFFTEKHEKHAPTVRSMLRQFGARRGTAARCRAYHPGNV